MINYGISDEGIIALIVGGIIFIVGTILNTWISLYVIPKRRRKKGIKGHFLD